MSKLIVITDDVIRQNETTCWLKVLAAGAERLHIRKPNASKEDLKYLLNEVPAEWRKKLVIHYQPELAEQFELGGLHVSYKDYVKKFDHRGAETQRFIIPVSCSVHSWEEAKEVIDTCAYCFISPVFDSISKTGYVANDELKQVPAALRGRKIYALGGINADNAAEALSNGYYGIVALGHIWNSRENAHERVKELLQPTKNKNELI